MFALRLRLIVKYSESRSKFIDTLLLNSESTREFLRSYVLTVGSFYGQNQMVDVVMYLQTVGTLMQLPQGVYCLDNDRQGAKPKLAVGAACRVYQLKQTTTSGSGGGK